MALDVFKSLYKDRRIIYQLTKKELKTKYLGSYLGITWAFIQPTISILIFWFVFQVGFKSMPVDNFPFILWLMAAMIPWFFISDSIQTATRAILENSYLVNKMVFRVSLLPIIKILSSLIIHLFFIIFLFVMYWIYGYKLDLYYLQVIYYVFCSFAIVTAISLITSTLILFLKDIGEFVGMLLQFGFWITPIFWSLDMVPEKFHFLFKLNPFFYITEGYRETFIYKKWFWDSLLMTSYFWIVVLILMTIGIVLFKKLKPHFSDVL